MARLTEKAVADQIGKLKGNVAAVARAFGVTRQSVSEYINRRPALAALLADAREEMVDNAESALGRAVVSGEAWAVCFTLKTQGKGRGYVERQEITGKDGDDLFKSMTDAELKAAIAAELAAMSRTTEGATPPG